MFSETYSAKYPKAAAGLEKDRDVLLFIVDQGRDNFIERLGDIVTE